MFGYLRHDHQIIESGRVLWRNSGSSSLPKQDLPKTGAKITENFLVSSGMKIPLSGPELHSHLQWKCYQFRGTLLCFSEYPSPLILSLGITEKSLAFHFSSSWAPPSLSWTVLTLSLSSSEKRSSLFIMLASLHWSLSGMSSMYGEPSTGQSTPDAASPALSRRDGPPPAPCWQHNSFCSPRSLFSARTHCWLMSSLNPIYTIMRNFLKRKEEN